VLLAVAGLVPYEAVTPMGRAELISVTLPAKGLTSVIRMESVPLAPCAIDRFGAVAESEKLPPEPGMMRVSGVECVIVPLVPTIWMVYCPGTVLVCALKFTVIGPPGAFTEEGAKFAFTPDGRLPALTETLPERPPTKVTVIVSVGFVPGTRVTGARGTVTVKLGA